MLPQHELLGHLNGIAFINVCPALKLQKSGEPGQAALYTPAPLPGTAAQSEGSTVQWAVVHPEYPFQSSLSVLATG